MSSTFSVSCKNAVLLELSKKPNWNKLNKKIDVISVKKYETLPALAYSHTIVTV